MATLIRIIINPHLRDQTKTTFVDITLMEQKNKVHVYML